ncbi:hypothetical protein MGYG_00106 [Nannizzia gypsea CBS 118893]|uniref:Endo-1,3(4)-beta-glucanase n=1 Tax=Arthroderma gypseum (strain ATCC MYA-4604 / CBS 118893) TaxID=535722 RepID=E5R2S8_ARTGP|nr:hypothetical protein MGYG_00106 [Nannizzia gypsea CBS 118893]EFQ97062.1 hypothetical protein MGYG_00106 [Nannizzia gypsea CBS 118893]
MVLDSQQSSFSDDAPPSDSDSYFSGSEYAEGGKRSRFAKYPTRVELPPFSLTKRLFYWTESNYQRNISRLVEDRLEIARVLLNRFPTQEETDALISQASFSQNMPNYGGVIGLAAGSFIAKSKNAAAESAASKAASEQFTPNRPLFKLNPGALKGRLIRASFILPIFAIIGAGLGEVIGEAYSKVILVTDSRLARFRDDLSRADRREVEARIKQYQAEKLAAAHRRHNNAPSGGSRPQRAEYYPANDTSPTSNYDQQGVAESSYYQSQPDAQAGYSDQSAMGDSKILRETFRQQGENTGYSSSSSSSDTSDYSGDWRQPQRYPPTRDTTTPSTEGKSFWDDDASPVSSEFTSSSAGSSSPTASPSGSAWARIRQQSLGDSSANDGGYNDSPSGWSRR